MYVPARLYCATRESRVARVVQRDLVGGVSVAAVAMPVGVVSLSWSDMTLGFAGNLVYLARIAACQKRQLSVARQKGHNVELGLEPRAKHEAALARVFPIRCFDNCRVGDGRHRGSLFSKFKIRASGGFSSVLVGNPT